MLYSSEEGVDFPCPPRVPLSVSSLCGVLILLSIVTSSAYYALITL